MSDNETCGGCNERPKVKDQRYCRECFKAANRKYRKRIRAKLDRLKSLEDSLSGNNPLRDTAR